MSEGVGEAVAVGVVVWVGEALGDWVGVTVLVAVGDQVRVGKLAGVNVQVGLAVEVGSGVAEGKTVVKVGVAVIGRRPVTEGDGVGVARDDGSISSPPQAKK